MERRAFRVSGFLVVVALLAVGAAMVVLIGRAAGQPGDTGDIPIVWITVSGSLLLAVGAAGLTVVNPNEARVIQFFGQYVGTVREAGFRWTVPFSTKRRMSVRVRNFETARLKVSDADGNPVEIAAVVVWRVVDTAKAAFGVDNHIAYVVVQAEASSGCACYQAVQCTVVIKPVESK